MDPAGIGNDLRDPAFQISISTSKARHLLGGPMGSEIRGFCQERFRPLEDAFRANFDDGLELGASLAVTWRGRMVVDLWGGWSNIKRTRRWRKNTIVFVYSTTKIMLLLCVLRLIDQNRLHLDEPVCRYWKAFGQGGKDKVTVRDFITHQGGVPGFVPPVTAADLTDWHRMTAHIAAQPHRFGGKKELCYHAVTYGFVLGELIRRVDGRMPSQYFREEFAEWLGADFHMGLSSWWQLLRVAETTQLVEDNAQVPDDSRIPVPKQAEMAKEVWSSVDFFSPEAQKFMRTWRFASATVPAMLGFGNGRSIARLCSVMAMNGRPGWRRYLSKAIISEAASQQIYGEDLYIGRISWGLGFGLDSVDYPAPSPTAFHWGGIGGSWGLMDPAAKISFGYAPNHFLIAQGAKSDPRVARFNEALREIIQNLHR
jgi:CubicO group peptidase (beta-lactamase class C family)